MEKSLKLDEEDLGSCPLCNRIMLVGTSVDKHHLVPKSKGGGDSYWVHKICHQKIHSLFTNKDLAEEYNTFEKLKQHFEIDKFIKWVSNKDPEFYAKSNPSKNKTRKKRIRKNEV